MSKNMNIGVERATLRRETYKQAEKVGSGAPRFRMRDLGNGRYGKSGGARRSAKKKRQEEQRQQILTQLNEQVSNIPLAEVFPEGLTFTGNMITPTVQDQIREFQEYSMPENMHIVTPMTRAVQNCPCVDCQRARNLSNSPQPGDRVRGSDGQMGWLLPSGRVEVPGPGGYMMVVDRWDESRAHPVDVRRSIARVTEEARRQLSMGFWDTVSKPTLREPREEVQEVTTRERRVRVAA